MGAGDIKHALAAEDNHGVLVGRQGQGARDAHCCVAARAFLIACHAYI
jgi:hypothetical protein